MQSTFLDQLAQEIRREHGTQLVDVCVVLPSRRAALFLREALGRAYQQSIWSPRILAVQDFVRELSGWQFPESLALIFELYEVYKDRIRKETPEWSESFEQFYAWGEMLLNDFDEVDRYLVDAQGLFTNIRDLKRIEAEFGLSEEDQEALANFWRSVHGADGEEYSKVKSVFLQIWEVLYEVYEGFREALQARNHAYDGMAYRYVAEELMADRLELPWRQVIFAGFNSLSGAEEQIVRRLLEEKRALIYWDMDSSYLPPDRPDPEERWRDNPIAQEAGRFIRPLHKAWKDKGSHLILTDMGAEPKEVYLAGVPLGVGEAEYLGALLEKKLPAEASEAELRSHAVVLADENLLFPVLYALPDSVSRLNITMGFPLRQTSIYHLLVNVALLIRNQTLETERLFSYQEVLVLLNNPYLKALEPHLSEQLQTSIRTRNLVFVPEDFFLSQKLPPLLAHLFDPPAQREGLEAYFDKLFDELLNEAQSRQAHLESEYIFQFFTLFNRLKDILERYEETLSLKGFVDIFREVIRKGRIPFEGEPLEGLQVMGFLETRTLDFDHLYILGANEGLLPDTSSGNSFVPYSLRKGFRMPTYEEKDALYAYHFYRLLQRAKEVHVVYNSNIMENGSAGEMSRFIRQLRHFGELYPSFHIQEQNISTPAPFSGQPEIRIPAGPDTLKVLEERFVGTGPGRYLSATGLSTYLNCSLRFYFRYVAELKEPESLEESMEANTFGLVLHATMEDLYQPFVGKTVDSGTVEFLGTQLESRLREAFVKNNLGWGEKLLGKNFLYRDVIFRLCKEILAHDHESERFEIAHLEEGKQFLTRLMVGEKPVRINGMFDRVDHLLDKGEMRIIDYKTGNVEFSKPFQVADCFHPETQIKSAKGLKEAFQGYLYAWLYLRQFPENPVTVGYYTARKLKQGVVYLNDGQPVSETQAMEVEKELGDLLDRIFTEDFTQTEDEQKCMICPYREICDR